MKVSARGPLMPSGTTSAQNKIAKRFYCGVTLLKITADYREKTSGLIDLLKYRGVLVETTKVPYGDYIINNDITIERKTAKDFLISIIDGRLFKQLSNLKKYCSNPILLIEGNPY